MANGIEKWIEKLSKAEKTCIVQDNRRKVHYTFPDKTELAEEYSIQTGEIVVRKWRKKSTLGAVLPWEYEIGMNAEDLSKAMSNLEMNESSSNPILCRQDTLNAFQWRIRNMTFPSDNYMVELDEEQRVILVKTKKQKIL